MEGITEIIKVILYNVPAFLHELIIESIRPRRLIKRQMLNDTVNFTTAERHLKNTKVQIRIQRKDGS
jgi:hypothetical protein